MTICFLCLRDILFSGLRDIPQKTNLFARGSFALAWSIDLRMALPMGLNFSGLHIHVLWASARDLGAFSASRAEAVPSSSPSPEALFWREKRMTDEQQIDDAVRTRLLADPTLDATKIDDMVSLAQQSLRLAIVPGRSGFHVRPNDLAKFLMDVSHRPGFRKDGGKTVNPDATTFSAEEFRSLSPLNRLRIANSGGVTASSDGRVTRFQRA